jgi:predicted nucleic acid-binding protein
MAERAYFDTSVVVKRYVNEHGSVLARRLLRTYRIFSSVLVPLEALSTFARRRAAGELSEASFRAIMTRMITDRRQWELVELTAPILVSAEEVVERTRIHTLDALHVASAIAIRERSSAALPFVTADERQGDAAQQMGFSVIRVVSI